MDSRIIVVASRGGTSFEVAVLVEPTVRNAFGDLWTSGTGDVLENEGREVFLGDCSPRGDCKLYPTNVSDTTFQSSFLTPLKLEIGVKSPSVATSSALEEEYPSSSGAGLLRVNSDLCFVKCDNESGRPLEDTPLGETGGSAPRGDSGRGKVGEEAFGKVLKDPSGDSLFSRLTSFRSSKTGSFPDNDL